MKRLNYNIFLPTCQVVHIKVPMLTLASSFLKEARTPSRLGSLLGLGCLFGLRRRVGLLDGKVHPESFRLRLRTLRSLLEFCVQVKGLIRGFRVSRPVCSGLGIGVYRVGDLV